MAVPVLAMEPRQKYALDAGFDAAFGGEPTRYFSAPGRTEIGGNHTDHQRGRVLAAAVNLDTVAAVRVNGTEKIRILSAGYPLYEVDVNDLTPREEEINTTPALIRGVAARFRQLGCDVKGFDAYCESTVLPGSGLSSSAAIEVATAVAFSAYAGVEYDKVEIALLSQKAENEYAGVNCGIMDQFASAMGKKDHAVLLNCSTLEYEYVPLQLGEYCLVVANCNKPHNLIESKYNVRRQEVETALKAIQKVLPVSCLAEISPKQFSEVKYLLAGVVEKRAEHVVMECDRVNRAVEALKAGDLEELGRLLNESHYSLRDLYEVTGKELDTLSALARTEAGCLGSRMIGAGFGGCTISIVKKTMVENFIRHVDKAYYDAIGYKASFYETSIEDGITVEKL
jgi:galactokinase